MDLSNSFDVLDQSFFINKLKGPGFWIKSCEYIKNYSTDRTQNIANVTCEKMFIMSQHKLWFFAHFSSKAS